MAKTLTAHSEKILEMTPELRKQVVDNYASMRPVELAYFFSLAGPGERTLMTEALNQTSPEHRIKTNYYINHPLELADELRRKQSS